jgi:aminopeptidase N
LKLNVDGAGNYRVQYDSRSWDSLVASLSELTLPDRVNLLCDIWALVQADRVPFATFFGLVDKLPRSTELAQWDQVANIFTSIDRLLVHEPSREKFQEYARSVVRPVFDMLGWDPKEGEASDISTLRGRLIASLGMLGDPEIISTCRERFQKYVTDPKSLSPDLRRATFAVVARDADDSTWAKLHELGLNTTNIEEKQNYYDALAHARAPKLVQKTLAIAVSNELPPSAAAFLPGKVARASEHPELAWTFAKANMKSLLGKVDATSINNYAPTFFTFFSEPARIGELKAYAKANLSTSSSKDVAKAVDEIQFQSEFKKRLSSQFATWIENRRPPN